MRLILQMRISSSSPFSLLLPLLWFGVFSLLSLILDSFDCGKIWHGQEGCTAKEVTVLTRRRRRMALGCGCHHNGGGEGTQILPILMVREWRWDQRENL
jgi:hypothetical protein